jgi:exodeoxyribonuclease V alpha subunit
MSPQPESSTQEVLAGLVERVTYHNAENGFCVLRARARGHRDVVTVVGHAATISAGEWITASGEWVNDRTHGQQFKARFLRTSPPTSADGIEKYLSSGMIRGVGPVYAKKLVRAFGEKVFEVIETTPDRLREVDGIGPVRAASILAAWAEQKAVREIMIFLHSHGVGTARAVRIFKTYGSDAIQVMSENPYRLARDIRGIGFKTADAIAMKLGIEKSAMIRVRAGISYALTEAMDEGHCGLPTDELVPLAEKLRQRLTACGMMGSRRRAVPNSHGHHGGGVVVNPTELRLYQNRRVQCAQKGPRLRIGKHQHLPPLEPWIGWVDAAAQPSANEDVPSSRQSLA